jgi:enoyl-CoA hydratase
MAEPRIEDDREVRWITMDRPEVANALTLDDLAIITDAARGLGPGTRAIVLTGAGERSFSAGMHVDTFAGLDPGTSRAVITKVRDCIGAIRLAPVPTIAMINGYCLGAAFEMALACDLRAAHADVRFGLPEVKLGIPSVIDAALLYHFVGLSKAKEIIMTGDLYSAADLACFGLVNRIAERGRLRHAVDELLRSVTAPTREVMAAQKLLFETWLNHGLQHGIDTSVDVFAGLFSAPATTEAIDRYRARRADREARG